MYLGPTEGEAKKGNLICRHNSALILVDPEFETTFQKAFQAFHDSLSRLSALHQNDEIVGIADETMVAFFQLFIQIIQDDVGKQG